MVKTTRHPSLPTGPIAVIAAGLLIALAAVLADSLGISGGGDGFGWKQLIAVITGLMIVVMGAAWLLRPVLDQPAAQLEEE